MIKTNAQRDRTLVQIAGFKNALKGVDRGASKRSIAIRRSYLQILGQLEDEIREYERLKSGAATVPRLDRLDHIAGFITKIRIAKGISQTELARRIRVSKQVISRLEDSDYQTAGIQTLQRILEALGVKTAIRHTPAAPQD
jgi:HTH-type transcriptional regulator/antitoxin HigA